MAARKDKSNTAGQFKKGDQRAKDCQLAAAEKKSENAQRMNRMMSIAHKNCSDEDRAAWWKMLKDEIGKGNLKALELALKIVGEMPNEKIDMGMTLNTMSDEDRALLNRATALLNRADKRG